MKISISLARFLFAPSIAMALSLALPSSAIALISAHDCADCHSLHGAPGFTLLNQASQADLVLTAELVCLNCHGPSGSATTMATVHTNDPNDNTPDYPAFRISCIECHDPHDNQDNYLSGQNIRLVLPQIATPSSGPRDIAFESRGTNNAGGPALHSFADGDSTYDGICEACHTATSHHLNNAAGDHGHHAGETCTRCHDHTDAFNQ